MLYTDVAVMFFVHCLLDAQQLVVFSSKTTLSLCSPSVIAHLGCIMIKSDKHNVLLMYQQMISFCFVQSDSPLEAIRVFSVIFHHYLMQSFRKFSWEGYHWQLIRIGLNTILFCEKQETRCVEYHIVVYYYIKTIRTSGFCLFWLLRLTQCADTVLHGFVLRQLLTHIHNNS